MRDEGRDEVEKAICPRVMMSAARMNIGTAISAAGWIPPIIC